MWNENTKFIGKYSHDKGTASLLSDQDRYFALINNHDGKEETKDFETKDQAVQWFINFVSEKLKQI